MSAQTHTRQYGDPIPIVDNLDEKMKEAALANGLDESLSGITVPVVPITAANDRFGTTVRDDFWLDDLNVLFRADRLGEFFPAPLHTINEQLNALSRFFIYLGALLALYRKSAKPFIFVAAIPCALLAYYFLQCVSSPADHHKGKRENFDTVSFKPQKPKERMRPTVKNPFMNPDPTMYGTADALLPAADVDDPQVQKEMLDAFDSDLWKDEDDIFDRKQGQLLFNTVPRFIDFGEFQDYLYRNPDDTCKENTARCAPPYRSFQNGKQTYTDVEITNTPNNTLNIADLGSI
jgi:hypothetical protein